MILKKIKNVVLQFGIEPKKFYYSLLSFPSFFKDLSKYQQMVKKSQYGMKISDLYPVLHEKRIEAGFGSGHYFHQDLWAARKIFKSAPARHIDIGSSIDSFISHLLVFREVEVIDIRPLKTSEPLLKFIQEDATELKSFKDSELESISTLHAIEHFGLGRYGDPIDPDGYSKFLKALVRVLKPGGRLYLATPCGKERLYFNAHRVFNASQLAEMAKPLELVSFSCVKDDGRFYENCSPSEVDNEDFGCGLFEFTKRV